MEMRIPSLLILSLIFIQQTIGFALFTTTTTTTTASSNNNNNIDNIEEDKDALLSTSPEQSCQESRDSSSPTRTMPRLLLTSSGLTTPAMVATFWKLYREAVAATKCTRIIYVYDAAMEPHDSSTAHTNNDDVAADNEVNNNNNYMTNEFKRMLGVESRDVAVIGVLLGSLKDGGAATLLQDLDAACIYLEQGNTYYLLYQVRRTKLDQSILKRVGDSGDGALLVGASAGSIVAGQTVKTCEWKNWDDPGHGTWWDVRALPTGLDGLDLMDGSVGRSLFPHHSAQWNRRIQEMMPRHPEGVIILDEEQFYVQGGGTTDEERVGQVRI